MANKRMFSRELTARDSFMDLSKEAQLLYFFIGLDADDDGIISNMKLILRMRQLPNSALQELLDNGFLHLFESGMYVIMHWGQNNNIRKDRYVASIHTSERDLLALKQNNEYQLIDEDTAVCGYNWRGIAVTFPGKDNTPATDDHDLTNMTDIADKAQALILYLSTKTGVVFDPESPASIDLLNGLLSSYKVDEIKLVIDSKVAELLPDEKLAKNLKSSILFGSKFQDYLAQAR